jgi:UDPglucose 6-dehydrogenase
MDGADCLLVLTEWNQFRSLDPKSIERRLRTPVVVDLRNIFNPAEMRAAGIRYVCLGRPDDAS